MKNKSSAGSIIVILLIAVFVIAAAVLPSALAHKYVEESAAPEEVSIPDGIPVVEWDEEDRDASMQRMEEYLITLEPEIAVENSPDFEWKDICPYHFWVKSFSVTTYEKASLKVYRFTYADDAENNRKMSADVDRQADKIIDVVKEKNCDDVWKIILTVHDELIRRTEFVGEDKTGAHIHDLYGALVEHKAVCQGYTYAFSYILDKLGIRSKDIYSEEHIWNKIEDLSGAERYIDVTWDDYNNADRFGVPYIHHDFFCITKKEMEQFDEHQPEDYSDTESNSETGDNYYRRMHYYIKSGDEIGFRACAMEQYESGKNLLEFRFESKEDFDKANDWMISILHELGYQGQYYIYSKKELLTFSAGLYVPDNAEQSKS